MIGEGTGKGLNTKLLPTFEARTRDGQRGLRLWLLALLSRYYGMDALLRHRALVKDALDHAEERARNGGDGCTS